MGKISLHGVLLYPMHRKGDLCLFLRVLSVNVNLTDCRFQDTNFGAVVGGFNREGLFLNADNFADDPTNRGDLIPPLAGCCACRWLRVPVSFAGES